MNTICLSGVLLFFLTQAIMYKSISALIISINGIIYYSKPKSKLRRNNDLFWNFTFSLMALKLSPASRQYMAIGILVWLINYMTIDDDLTHVVGVQIPLAIGLNKYLI
jgi:hypothetical protein